MNLTHLVVAVTVLSLGLYATMMVLFFRSLFRSRAEAWGKAMRRDVSSAPHVTVFKPLAGRDDELAENLESFSRIVYPSFEILLGVASQADPAHRVALRFLQAHPELRARLIVTAVDAAMNPKVAQLLTLEREATGDVYVISDSNVRVRHSYLWSLVDELVDARVGLVCSVFAGSGEQSVGAALENLQLCACSAPGVLAIDSVSRRPPTIGKSMAMRRRDLQRIGGFSVVGDVLAEDHALGRRFLDAGFAARTSLGVVENRNIDRSVKRTLERHTRWSKMRRALFPLPFVAEPLLTPVVVASLAAVVAPGKLTALAWAISCVLQTCSAMLAVRVLRGSWMSWRYLPLELVRSYVAFFCWVRACVSRRIDWRGHVFILKRGSVIEPLAPAGAPDAHHAADGHGRPRLAA